MRHLRPTTIIACLALFLSLGGGAWAAQYIITRTSQIAPSVRSQLKGHIRFYNKDVDVGPVALRTEVEAEVMCPAGSALTGGGGQVAGGKFAITGTTPAGMGRGWAIQAEAIRTPARGTITVFVSCQS